MNKVKITVRSSRFSFTYIIGTLIFCFCLTASGSWGSGVVEDWCPICPKCGYVDSAPASRYPTMPETWTCSSCGYTFNTRTGAGVTSGSNYQSSQDSYSEFPDWMVNNIETMTVEELADSYEPLYEAGGDGEYQYRLCMVKAGRFDAVQAELTRRQLAEYKKKKEKEARSKEKKRKEIENKKLEEARQKKKHQKKALAARKSWDAQDAESINAFKRILSTDYEKLQKPPCIFCVDGMRACPDCDNGIVKCSRSGCIDGKHVCGCVSAANNYEPDPNCPHCHGTGVTICEACHGKGSWVCPTCNGTGKIPCIFCNGLSIAGSVADIKPTSIGPSSINPTPITPANINSYIVFEDLSNSIIQHVVGPDNNWENITDKDLEKIRQREEELAQIQQKQIESTNIKAPEENSKSSEITDVRQKLKQQEAEVIKQVAGQAGIPKNDKEKKKLMDEVKNSIQNDAKIKDLNKQIEVASKLTVIPIKKNDLRSQIKGSLGVKVPPTREMIRTAFKQHENYKWALEAEILKNERLAKSSYETSDIAMDILRNKYGADYKKNNKLPGTSATFEDYIVKRGETDSECRKLNQTANNYFWSGVGYNLDESMAKSHLQQENEKFNKLLDSSSPSAPAIALKIRNEIMKERCKQLEKQIAEKRKELEEHKKKVAKIEQENQKKHENFKRRLKAERSSAEAEYNNLTSERKKKQSFEDYLFLKTANTLEGKELLNTEVYIDFETGVLQQNIYELNKAYENLRKRNTILNVTQ